MKIMKEIINIRANHLGTVKQAPYLIREIKKELPQAKINIFLDNDQTPNFSTKKILKRDLNYEGIDPEGIRIFNKKTDQLNLNNITINLDFFRDYYRGMKRFDFYVDPLKFEKRRLLSLEEISKLKEEYSISSEKVILGGSLNAKEINLLVKSTKNIITQNEGTQIIIVPRRFDKEEIEGIKRLDIKFRVDKAHKKNKPYLIITQRGGLDKLYSICDIAVIGDSFETGNGQNPLEPAFYGKRIISGMSNQMNVQAYRELEKSKLLTRIFPEDLEKELFREIPENEMAVYRENAKKFIESKQGAAKIYTQIIKDSLEGKLNGELFKKRIFQLP